MCVWLGIKCVCVSVKYLAENSLLYVQQTVKHFTLRIIFPAVMKKKEKIV